MTNTPIPLQLFTTLNFEHSYIYYEGRDFLIKLTSDAGLTYIGILDRDDEKLFYTLIEIDQAKANAYEEGKVSLRTLMDENTLFAAEGASVHDIQFIEQIKLEDIPENERPTYDAYFDEEFMVKPY
jgi:hypothetical protein